MIGRVLLTLICCQAFCTGLRTRITEPDGSDVDAAVALRMHVAARDDWTAQDLVAYDGSNPDAPILLAVGGRVFNVWRGRKFFGVGGHYNVFAGRDPTRLLAKRIFDSSNDDGAELTPGELEAVNGWVNQFSRKYEDVGAFGLADRMYIAARDDWTAADLAQYDGTDVDAPIVVAVGGRVFNVWRGRKFYGAGGHYNVLAGRDATRMLAKQMLDVSTDDGAELTSNEMDAVKGWLTHFSKKYDDVGSFAGFPEAGPTVDH